MPTSLPSPKPRVGLFVTCLVDLVRPSIGFAAVKLLEDAGCRVEVPSQTCCGQPAYNSGDRAQMGRAGPPCHDNWAALFSPASRAIVSV